MWRCITSSFPTFDDRLRQCRSRRGPVCHSVCHCVSGAKCQPAIIVYDIKSSGCRQLGPKTTIAPQLSLSGEAALPLQHCLTTPSAERLSTTPTCLKESCNLLSAEN